MILSTNSCTFKNGTAQEKIELMKALGFTGAGADNSPDLAPDAWDDFENIAVHAPFIDLNLISGVKDVRELARQKCLSCIEWSGKIGAKTIAFHPGSPTCEISEDEVDGIMRDRMIEFDEHAGRHGMWACWETGTGYFVPLKKFEMIRELGLKSSGICLDSGHLVRVWKQISLNDEIKTFPDFIYRFKDLIKCTHIHDWIDEPVRGAGWQDHYMVGDGIIDWHEFFSLLVEIGYDGDILLEYHPESFDTIDELKANLDKLRTIVKDAGGELK